MSTLEGVTQHINQLNNTTMNNPIKYCIGILVSVMLTACSTSTISNKVNLNLYEYASIVNHIPTELVEYEFELFEAIETSRLEMIGEHRINDLTPQQQSKLLLVKFGVNQYDDETTTVTVSFTDFMTGRPVASCRGVCFTGINRAGNLRGAINNVSKQISKTFPCSN